MTEFADGVWMADLGALPGPDLMAETVATALGLRESRHRSADGALREYLRERELLLVLDTCEHVVAACAALVDALLRAAPGLHVLATSREALSVPGEVVYRVPSLSIGMDGLAPDASDGDAVRLFVERALVIDPAFEHTAANAEAITRICRRLDGIPLAIELAAARVAVIAPTEIEARLRDRFQLLTGGARTAVARQRTLEATMDWSYQLLSPDERLLLNRLSVFPASWTFEAADEVCAGAPLPADETLDLLSRLIDKSLVVLDRLGSDRPRYRLLDTVQQYAAARLANDGETASVRGRHFDYFYACFHDSQQVLRGRDQLRRLALLGSEHESLRAALEWGLSANKRAADAVELAGAVSWYWTKRGLFEEGKRWLQRALALAVAPRSRARALYGLAHMHHFQGDQPMVATCGVEVESLGVATGETWAVAAGRFLQALAAFELGDLDWAHARALASRESAEAHGAVVEHGGPLMILANVQLARGNQEEALRLYEESIDVHRQAGEIWGLSIILSITAGLRIVRDDFVAAGVQGTEALALGRALDDPRGVAWGLEVFAGLLAAEGQGQKAVRLWGVSDALLEASGGTLTATIGWIRDRYLEPTRSTLGEVAFAAGRAEGHRLSVDDAVALIHGDAEETSGVRGPSTAGRSRRGL